MFFDAIKSNKEKYREICKKYKIEVNEVALQVNGYLCKSAELIGPDK